LNNHPMAKIEASNEPKQSSLKRVIGRRMLLFFVLGDILGSGIYVLVGKVGGMSEACSGCRFCWPSYLLY
jgi:hypothetical protein